MLGLNHCKLLTKIHERFKIWKRMVINELIRFVRMAPRRCLCGVKQCKYCYCPGVVHQNNWELFLKSDKKDINMLHSIQDSTQNINLCFLWICFGLKLRLA